MKLARKYKRHFVVDEAKLRRIATTVSSCPLPEGLTWVQYFELTRADGTEQTLEDLEDVLLGVNGGRLAIQKLKIRCHGAREHDRYSYYDSPECVVLFNADVDSYEGGITVEVSKLDKRAAFLLIDELETHVERSLRPARSYWTRTLEHLDYLAPGLLIAAGLMGVALLAGVSPPALRQAGTTDAKLDYIIEYLQATSRARSSDVFVLGVGTAIVLIAIMLIELLHGLHIFGRLAKWPTGSWFYWGDQVAIYDSRARVVSNVAWVVAVGFLVSLVAGLAVAILMRK